MFYQLALDLERNILFRSGASESKSWPEHKYPTAHLDALAAVRYPLRR